MSSTANIPSAAGDPWTLARLRLSLDRKRLLGDLNYTNHESLHRKVVSIKATTIALSQSKPTGWLKTYSRLLDKYRKHDAAHQAALTETGSNGSFASLRELEVVGNLGELVKKKNEQDVAAWYLIRKPVKDDGLFGPDPESTEDDPELDAAARQRRQAAHDRATKALQKAERRPVQEITALRERTISKSDIYTTFIHGRNAILSTMPDIYIPATIPGLSTTLYPLQQLSLARLEFCLRHVDGAILGEKMGMGKTVIVIAYIIRCAAIRRAEGRHFRALIIVPKNLIGTWQAAWKKFSPLTSVYVNHSSDVVRRTSFRDLQDHQVTIATYDTIRSEWHRNKISQRNFTYVHGGLDGVKQSASYFYDMSKKRIVHTTHEADAMQAMERFYPSSVRPLCPTYSVDWDVVVMDESHVLRNPDTQKTSACQDIPADKKICMTGTPIQNAVTDLASLLRMIRYHPWSNDRFFTSCFGLGENEGNGLADESRDDRELILACILKSVLIRTPIPKTATGAGTSHISSPHTEDYSVKLYPAEQAMQEPSKTLWDSAVAQSQRSEFDDGDRLRGAELLRVLFEARMHCLHPLLSTAGYGDDGGTDFHVFDENAELANFIIGGRQNSITFPQSTRNNEKKSLSNRRESFLNRLKQTPETWRSSRMEAAVDLIRNILSETRAFASTLPTHEQEDYLAYSNILVFSEYLAPLDVLAYALEDQLGKACLRYDGTCSSEEKSAVVAKYEQTVERNELAGLLPKIMLGTSKSMAEGLNLVHTRHIIFLSPCWNPQVELQCIHRGARIGNPRDIIVHTLYARNSIEIRLRLTQLRKTQFVQAVMGDTFSDQDMDKLMRHDANSVYSTLNAAHIISKDGVLVQ